MTSVSSHVFFVFVDLQNTANLKKPQVISGGSAHPQHPSSRSNPDIDIDEIPGQRFLGVIFILCAGIFLRFSKPFVLLVVENIYVEIR